MTTPMTAAEVSECRARYSGNIGNPDVIRLADAFDAMRAERDVAVKRVKDLEAGLDSYWKEHDETLADQLVAIKARYDQLEGERRAAVAERDAARKRIADLEFSLAESESLVISHEGRIEIVTSERDAAVKRAGELEEGLRPFAEIVSRLPMNSVYAHDIRADDCRKAAALLAAKE